MCVLGIGRMAELLDVGSRIERRQSYFCSFNKAIRYQFPGRISLNAHSYRINLKSFFRSIEFPSTYSTKIEQNCPSIHHTSSDETLKPNPSPDSR